MTGYTMALGGLVTALYDIELKDKIDLFLGIGTGVSGATLSIKKLGPSNPMRDYKSTLFSYQLLGGFAWRFTQRTSARFIYKYFKTAGSEDFDSLGSHNLELGVEVDL